MKIRKIKKRMSHIYRYGKKHPHKRAEMFGLYWSMYICVSQLTDERCKEIVHDLEGTFFPVEQRVVRRVYKTHALKHMMDKGLRKIKSLPVQNDY